MPVAHPGPRPAVHFTPPTGWLNDPLGLTWHRGRYHLFYQAVPDSTVWQAWCHWGHASSPDLLEWTHHPVALAPGEGDGGCWSGSVLPGEGDHPATIYYTAVDLADPDQGAVRVAHPQDEDWHAWRKGPVVVRPPAGMRIFRDPSVLREGDGWRLLVGAGYDDGRPAVLTYTSSNGTDWQPDGELIVGTALPGIMQGWECPHLITVGDRHVLIVSLWAEGEAGDVLAGVGRYAAGRLEVDTWCRLAQGPGHYAPTAFLDADGRPGLLFWIKGIGDAAGEWSGALSVPYLISVEDGEARLRPHPVLDGLAADVRGSGTGPHVISWRPDPASGPLTVISAAGTDSTDNTDNTDGTGGTGSLVTLRAVPGAVEVSAGGRTAGLPTGRDPVTVIVDGPVLEVCSGRGVLGLSLGASVRASPGAGE